MIDRREFVKNLALASGSVVLMPLVTACESAPKTKEATKVATEVAKDNVVAKAAVPKSKPATWDPVAFNKLRGNQGAIPKSYLDDINGTDGVKKHLGKHLPYVPKVDAAMVPKGYIAIMWGDPQKGYARHPNAAKSEANKEGHWYNWIRIRKAVDGEAKELQSQYSDWPGKVESDNGAYAVFGGGEMTADGGRNTIYLAALPDDVKAGDTIRIHAHCLTHGEYVDFITI